MPVVTAGGVGDGAVGVPVVPRLPVLAAVDSAGADLQGPPSELILVWYLIRISLCSRLSSASRVPCASLLRLVQNTFAAVRKSATGCTSCSPAGRPRPEAAACR